MLHNSVKSPSPRGDVAPKAVVIGTGFGGLAAAVRLLARGYRVTLLEQLDAPGGRAYVYRQDGFSFDAGPTIVTVPFLLEELWELAGERMADHITLKEMAPYFRMRFDDGVEFNYWGDMEKMLAEVGALNPRDVAGFKKFLAYSEKTYQAGFVELGDIPFHRFMTMAKATPKLVALGARVTVYDMIARFIKNERLRTVLSFHPLLVGGNPFTTTAIYNLIGYLENRFGVHYAMGGTGALVSGLVELIERQGGAIEYNARAVEILLDDRGHACGVQLQDGRAFDADIVVSNADVGHTYKYLVPKAARRTWTDAKIDRMRYSMSCFLWYFGTNKRYDDVVHHNILLGPRYRPLLDDIFKHHHLADDFSIYLHRPSATDPSVAPEGCDAFYALVPVPHLDSGTDWEDEAPRYKARVQAYLERTILPGLSNHIVTECLQTPLDFKDRLLSERGAAFSFEPRLLQSAWFRTHNKSEDVEGLYFVGAGTHPGAGLPGVVSSAKVLDKVVPDVSAFA